MSENNHYLPIFYQRRWGTRAQQACLRILATLQNAPQEILEASPAGVGYQTDLYTVSDVDAAGREDLPLRSNSSLVTDDLAAKALISHRVRSMAAYGYDDAKRVDPLHHVASTPQP